MDDCARIVVVEQRKAKGIARPKVSDAYADYMKQAHAYPNFTQNQFRYRVKLWEEKLLADRSVLVMEGVAPDERTDAEEEEEEDVEEKEVLKTGVSDESRGEGGMPELIEAAAAEAEAKKARRGGRPTNESKRASEEAKKSQNEAVTEARNLAVKIISERLEGGDENVVYNKVIRDCEKKFNLDEGSVSQQSVSYRIKNNPGHVSHRGPTGPLEGPIEDLLVDLLLKFAKFGFPMNKVEILALVNSWLEDTKLGKEIVEKKVAESNESDDGKIMGVRWFSNFLIRRKEEIKNEYPQLFDGKRHEWNKYANYEEMYARIDRAVLDCNLGVRATFDITSVIYTY